VKEALISLVVLIPSFLSPVRQSNNQDKSINVNGEIYICICVSQHNDKHWEIKTQNNGFVRGKDTSHFPLFSGFACPILKLSSAVKQKNFLFTDFGTEKISFLFIWDCGG
jgi:hypothetical protein